MGFHQTEKVCPFVKGPQQPTDAAVNGQTISNPLSKVPRADRCRDKWTDHFQSNGAQMGQKVCPFVDAALVERGFPDLAL
jgi:hypothetical protein